MELYEEVRPWGFFRRFAHNEKVTVKILHIEAGQELSLQVHENRSEFWRVLSGNPTMTLGQREIVAKPGDEFETQKGEAHRISATPDSGPVEILEVARGQFDEKDEVRLDDKYGRS